MRNSPWKVTADLAFPQVMERCAQLRESTWIMPEMIYAYGLLHRQGHAHSIEIWDGETLIGGLYGIALGCMFFGESMVSERTNASKIVLVQLCRVLSRWGFSWMDCQVPNPHLLSMGAEAMDRDQFLAGLNERVDQPSKPGPWSKRFAATLAAPDGSGSSKK
jgi:leucyl/phenylalanyl-tRNA--protein transferase